eukprot:CAMPEP_0174315260 /NCGR_PEP_ID=MMETSP0810-20121108/6176_1 /TAXON_ID=73025 ORGANISM="Eutreptiella gymnastica-like, Strain CCMP1594" /NCGR_SAMPLE_ID=MMETSP0810 /ASSEMBLY_ACC=CAM_ASM_000659 /LENGTH=67 /DNA_ID=CAMNT_0015424603 /DNA_START=459 /DNA_END=662 /DNA_ORIENTATION=+
MTRAVGAQGRAGEESQGPDTGTPTQSAQSTGPKGMFRKKNWGNLRYTAFLQKTPKGTVRTGRWGEVF